MNLFNFYHYLCLPVMEDKNNETRKLKVIQNGRYIQDKYFNLSNSLTEEEKKKEIVDTCKKHFGQRYFGINFKNEKIEIGDKDE